MSSQDKQSLMVDTYGMTSAAITARRVELEEAGWTLSREIPTRDMGNRTHVNLVFTRDYEDESDKMEAMRGPRGLTVGYVLMVCVFFTGFVLLHPKQEAATVTAGVTVERREMVIPSVGRPANANRAVPVKRVKPPRKVAEVQQWRDAIGGGNVMPR